jgi:stringent starvation protein B
MADEAPPQRLQEIKMALAHKSISDSLARVEEALVAWRQDERNVLVAHAEILRHAARTKVLSDRIARSDVDGPSTLLRDALDAGVISEDEARKLLGRDPAGVPPSPSLDDEAARVAGPERPAKRLTMDKLLHDGPVLVHLDPRRPGVDVPVQHRTEPRLVLRFGYGLTPPIVDLTVEELAVSGTLTFGGVPHLCLVPWSAVFAIVDEENRGFIWGEDVPVEIAHEYSRDPRGQTSAKPQPQDKGGARPARARKAEKADKSGDANDPPSPPPSSPDPSTPGKPRRGHLKLV